MAAGLQKIVYRLETSPEAVHASFLKKNIVNNRTFFL